MRGNVKVPSIRRRRRRDGVDGRDRTGRIPETSARLHRRALVVWTLPGWWRRTRRRLVTTIDTGSGTGVSPCLLDLRPRCHNFSRGLRKQETAHGGQIDGLLIRARSV